DGERDGIGERERERERQRERNLERYRSYRLAVAEHHAGLTTIWQEMRFSGLEPSGKAAGAAGQPLTGKSSEAYDQRTGSNNMPAKSSAGKASASDRLAERVLAPLAVVLEQRMPAVIDGLQSDREAGELAVRHAKVVDGLRNVAKELTRAEGFQEAVRLVEELQDGQRAVLAETLETERRRVRELLDRPNK
ncbi:MAG: hypothetical protein RLY70_1572, partial [Planctomycetota bacterium]